MKDSDWKILYELYKNPNMTKVANSLYITQPTLTKRLQNIEKEFGVTIVNRMPKGLEFTPEGEYLGKQAEIYLEFLKNTQQELKKLRQAGKNIITVGSSYTYSKYGLSDLIIKYRAEHPEIHFNVINESSDVLFQRMLEGSIDVGFIQGDYEGQVNRIFVGRNQAYIVSGKPLLVGELPGLQRLSYKTNKQTQEILDAWYVEQFGIAPPANMVVGYVDVALQMVQRGIGYVCCFLHDQFVSSHDLCLTPMTYLDGAPIMRNTWFIYSKNKRIPDVLERFIRYVEAELKNLVEE